MTLFVFVFNSEQYPDEFFHPIQDGVQKALPPPPTSFFPVTSTNGGVSHKKFLTFSFNLFATF